MTCASCGASLRTDATWCGQCFTTQAAESPASPPTRPTPRQEPPRQPPTFSRWHGGVTSLGPSGRIAWTVGMVGFGVLFLFSGNPFTIGPWWLIAMPLVLRSVWAKKRVT